jgi:uncharacterized protein YllA (UPF0747 family)
VLEAVQELVQFKHENVGCRKEIMEMRREIEKMRVELELKWDRVVGEAVEKEKKVVRREVAQWKFDGVEDFVKDNKEKVEDKNVRVLTLNWGEVNQLVIPSNYQS